MKNIDHLFHENNTKPESQCVECRFQNEVIRAKQEEIDAQIDQALEDKYHSHGDRK